MRDKPARLAVVVAMVLLVAVGVAGCGTHQGASGARDSAAVTGCSPDVPPITEASGSTGTVRSQVPPMPMKIEPVDDALVGTPPFKKVVDGLPARGMHYVGDITDVVYSEGSVDGQTPDEFLGGGGLSLETYDVTDGGPSVVEQTRQLDPGGVVDVRVGPYDGLVRRGDPIAGRSRQFVMWTDDQGHNFLLVGVRAPEDLVRTARSLVC